MNVEEADREAAAALHPRDVLAYLAAQAWTVHDQLSDRAVILRRNDTSDEHTGLSPEILLPTRASVGDFARRMNELVLDLARFEERPVAAVLADLATSGCDTIRFRAPGISETGGLPIEQGVKFFTAAQDLILSAACSAVEPRAAYHLGKVVEARDYLRTVRLGHTERGSYVVTVLSPVDPPLRLQPNLFDADFEPFSRRVTRTLYLAMHQLRAALGSSNAEGDSAFAAGVSAGVSANLCEATEQLIESGGGLDIRVNWAKTRPNAMSTGGWLRFVHSDAPTLRSAAVDFRSREPVPDQTMAGTLMRLDRADPTRPFDGKATLLTVIDGRPRRVTLNFPESDREAVVAAFERGIWVSVTGDLVQSGSRYELQNPRRMTIIASQNDDGSDGKD